MGQAKQSIQHVCGLAEQSIQHVCGLAEQSIQHVCGLAEQSIQHVCGLAEQKQARDGEKGPVGFKPYYKTLLSENLGTHCREWPAGKASAEV